MACKDHSRSWVRFPFARVARVVPVDAFVEADKRAKRKAERYAQVLRAWLATKSCPQPCITGRDVSNPVRDGVRGWPHPDGRRYVIEVSYKIVVTLTCDEPPPQVEPDDPDEPPQPPDDDDDGPNEEEPDEEEQECPGPMPSVTVSAGTQLTPQSPWFRADGIGPDPTATSAWATWKTGALSVAAAEMTTRLQTAVCTEGCRAEWDEDPEYELATLNVLQGGSPGLKYWYKLRNEVTAVCVPE